MSIHSQDIKIREIQFDSDDYRQELRLRADVLRTPIGLTLSDADTEHDASDRHIAAFHNERLIGCCLLRPSPTVSSDEPKQVKMRQVAVDPSAQGAGVGRALVERFEELARSLGAREIVLDARVSAVPFYLQLGYQITSELFTQVSVPHRKMRKHL